MGTSTQEGLLLLKENIFITTMSFLRATLLICAAAVALTEASQCPVGWSQHALRCFRYIPHKVTWIAAEKSCMSMGGNLASLHSAEEHTFVQDMVKKAGGGNHVSWLGATDAVKEGTWLWSDGHHMKYTAWGHGQPDNWKGIQNCMGMNWSNARLWDDQLCTWHNTYVCAMDAAGRRF